MKSSSSNNPSKASKQTRKGKNKASKDSEEDIQRKKATDDAFSFIEEEKHRRHQFEDVCLEKLENGVPLTEEEEAFVQYLEVHEVHPPQDPLSEDEQDPTRIQDALEPLGRGSKITEGTHMFSSIKQLTGKQMTDTINAQRKAFRMNPSPPGDPHPDINLSNQGRRGIIDSEGKIRKISDLLLDEKFKVKILYLGITRDHDTLKIVRPSGWSGLTAHDNLSESGDFDEWVGEFINIWIDCFPEAYWTLLEKILSSKSSQGPVNIKGVLTRLQDLFTSVKVGTGSTQWENLYSRAVDIIDDCKTQHNDIYGGSVQWDTLWRYLVIHMFPRTTHLTTGRPEFKTQPSVPAKIIAKYIIAGLETKPPNLEAFILKFIRVQEDITELLARNEEYGIEELYAMKSLSISRHTGKDTSVGPHHGKDTGGKGSHKGKDTSEQSRKRSRQDQTNSKGSVYGPGSNSSSKNCDG
jgi:hypothetical protein